MWDSSCSGNAQKTNLRQFFAAAHWATPGGFIWKVWGEQSSSAFENY